MTARSLQEHLASGDSMGRLAAHAKRLLEFQSLLEAALPEVLRPHARVANFRLGKLFIHAANGAVAAKLRQFSPSLASELSVSGVKITQIEVRVQAQHPTCRQSPHIRPILPGEKQKQGLTALTQNMPDESPLKQALNRLLRTVKE